jgi:hypothetical protein
LSTSGAAIVTPSLWRPLEAQWRSLLGDGCYNLMVQLQDGKPLELGKDVSVCSSGRRGQGVFALRDLRAGELVGRYGGKLQSASDYEADVRRGQTSGDYAFELGDSGWIIDGEDPECSTWLRYCNHSVRRQNCEAGACKLFGDTVGIYLEVSKPVKAGQELLFNYGKTYWDRELGPGRLRPRRLLIDFW